MSSPISIRDLAASARAEVPGVEMLAGLADDALVGLLRDGESLRRVADDLVALVSSEIASRSARERGHEGLAQRAGFGDAARFVQDSLGTTLGEARRLVASGEAVRAGLAVTAPASDPTALVEPLDDLLARLALAPGPWHAALGAAAKEGAISPAQRDAILGGLREPRADASTPEWRAAALGLLGEAVRSRLNADELGRRARSRRAELERGEAVREELTRFERRSAARIPQSDGMVLWRLLCDPESDAHLRAAVDALTGPRRGGPRFVDAEAAAAAAELERDPRSREQLQFDAVFGLLAAGGQADRSRLPDPAPVVRIVITRDQLHEDGLARLEGTAVAATAATARRNICDSGYVPLVFESSGAPLDVGRRQRTFTAKQREALAVRDGGCRAPGCAAPPAMCEAHHIREWQDGGATDIGNGILLCRFHHLNLHNNGGRITRDHDPGSAEERFWVHRPGAPARLLPGRGVSLMSG